MSDKPSYPGNTIMVRPAGPLICGSEKVVVVQDEQGNVIERAQELALCRCGRSKNKPFCDGSHKQSGFDGEQEFRDERAENISGHTGELVITVKPNAMLMFTGPVTLFSRSGNSTSTRLRGALCRCGGSQNKPFCDGSHKGCGFRG
ncbi:MAG: CDGSH iron-sulfur domain-containing protein [Gammaproteobacteria bacterium]|nr:CDGSH iron-sulfur domain-containing protein [Gammaproteobacteria bacterium]